ncbi:MAG: dephospho-CoA kinase [Myxococcales bacterium]|nr:dephospho-CoA kinase [Myxococcales bacterium]MDD9971637.1 dephospho-CoA kinase [Myxococcales bacterium]
MREDRQKPVIGLTGGIASGKSAVAKVLRALGVAVVDADQLAREVVAKGTEGLAELIREFGEDVVTETGELDRERMAGRVFGNAEARARLNAITHPRIAALSMARLAEMQTTDTPYVVYEVPLLVESGLHKSMAATIVVAADPDTQLARMAKRDGLDRAQAQTRIDAQLPLEEKVAIADYVIENNGGLEELEALTRDVHRQILERFQPR